MYYCRFGFTLVISYVPSVVAMELIYVSVRM